MRKKHLLLAFALIFLIVTLCVAVACDKHTEHAFSAEWTSNETHHWHSCSGCDEKNGYATHTFGEWMIVREPQGEEDGIKKRVCSECEYTEEQTFHVHTFSTEWTNDDTYHWHAATCEHTGEISEKAKHNYDNGEIITAAKCTEDGVKAFTCTECGYKKTETIPAIGHAFSSEWTCDATYHWHICDNGCGKTSDRAMHDFSNGNCICGNAVAKVEFTYTLKDDSYSVTGLNVGEGILTNTELVIPSEYGEKPVTAIALDAFRDEKWITDVKISDGITAIYGSAFAGCSNIKSITIPKSVNVISSTAFMDCGNIVSITVEEGNEIFVSVGKCLINDEMGILVRGCNNSRIPSAEELPSGYPVEKIGGWAFSGCSELTDIEIPESITKIGSEAFKNCISLKKVNIPAGVKANKFLHGVTKGAFIGCSSLESITVSSGNKFYKAVNNCLMVTIDNGVSYSLVLGCKNSIIPKDENVTTIEIYAFDTHTELKNIEIPDSVTLIKEQAFDGCVGLKTVTIGKGVKNISSFAFSGCTGLTDIYYKGTKEEWDSIEKKSEWDFNSDNYKIHCTDGDIAKG